jgi:hypothetical protein
MFVGTVASEWRGIKGNVGLLTLRAIDVRIESIIFSNSPLLDRKSVGSVIPVEDLTRLAYCDEPPRIDYVHLGDRIEVSGWVIETGGGVALSMTCDGYLINIGLASNQSNLVGTGIEYYLLVAICLSVPVCILAKRHQLRRRFHLSKSTPTGANGYP